MTTSRARLGRQPRSRGGRGGRLLHRIGRFVVRWWLLSRVADVRRRSTFPKRRNTAGRPAVCLRRPDRREGEPAALAERTAVVAVSSGPGNTTDGVGLYASD